MSIFSNIKAMRDVEVKAYDKGYKDAQKVARRELQKLLPNIGLNAQDAYERRWDEDRVGACTYSIMCKIDDTINTDYAGRKAFEKQRLAHYEKLRKAEKTVDKVK